MKPPSVLRSCILHAIFCGLPLVACGADLEEPTDTAPALPGAAIASGVLAEQRIDLALDRRQPGLEPGARHRLRSEFLQELAQNAAPASERLAAGTMDDEELETRVVTFLRLQQRLAVPAAASAPEHVEDPAATLVERFLRVNHGGGSARLQGLAFRGRMVKDGQAQEFAAYKMRPDRVRLHVLEGGLVKLALGSNGSVFWMQAPGGPAETAPAAGRRLLESMARFDSPLLRHREEGGTLILLPDTDARLHRLQLTQADGTVRTYGIERDTLREMQVEVRSPDGSVTETRFGDHRWVGPQRMAFRQEEWVGGRCTGTLTIALAQDSPGLIRDFFEPPPAGFGLMDCMAVLRRAAQGGRP